jgi:hypothetical protein
MITRDKIFFKTTEINKIESLKILNLFCMEELPQEITDRIIALSVTSKSISKVWTHFPGIKWYISETDICWDYISSCKHTSEEFISSFSDHVDWNYVSGRLMLSKEFLREFKDKIDWNLVLKYQDLSDEFIREVSSSIDWGWIQKKGEVSQSKINRILNIIVLPEEVRDRVVALSLTNKNTISEIWKYFPGIKYFFSETNLDWYAISAYEELSEDFIREFKDCVDWYAIFEYQNISEEFCGEFYLSYYPDL